MTLCPYDPTAATDCLWQLSSEATVLAVGSVGFAFLALLATLVICRAVARRGY
jgi:hypothetical protein